MQCMGYACYCTCRGCKSSSEPPATLAPVAPLCVYLFHHRIYTLSLLPALLITALGPSRLPVTVLFGVGFTVTPAAAMMVWVCVSGFTAKPRVTCGKVVSTSLGGLEKGRTGRWGLFACQVDFRCHHTSATPILSCNESVSRGAAACSTCSCRTPLATAPARLYVAVAVAVTADPGDSSCLNGRCLFDVMSTAVLTERLQPGALSSGCVRPLSESRAPTGLGGFIIGGMP